MVKADVRTKSYQPESKVSRYTIEISHIRTFLCHIFLVIAPIIRVDSIDAPEIRL